LVVWKYLESLPTVPPPKATAAKLGIFILSIVAEGRGGELLATLCCDTTRGFLDEQHGCPGQKAPGGAVSGKNQDFLLVNREPSRIY
jgi:hypothetical protein